MVSHEWCVLDCSQHDLEKQNNKKICVEQQHIDNRNIICFRREVILDCNKLDFVAC